MKKDLKFCRRHLDLNRVMFSDNKVKSHSNEPDVHFTIMSYVRSIALGTCMFLENISRYVFYSVFTNIK